jgi:hypothetical protein
MKEMNEQGFLSDKFDDWSGEPIPNGWGEINRNLRKDRKRKPLFWWLFPSTLLVGALSFFAIEKFNSIQESKLVEVSSFNHGSNKSDPNQMKGANHSGSNSQADQKNPEVVENKFGSSFQGHKNDRMSAISGKSLPIPRSESESINKRKNTGQRSPAVAGSALIASIDNNQSLSSKKAYESDTQPNSGNDQVATLSISKYSGRKKSGRTHMYNSGAELSVDEKVSQPGKYKGNLVTEKNGIGLLSTKSEIAGSSDEINKGRNSGNSNVVSDRKDAQATDVPFLESKNAGLPVVNSKEVIPVLTLKEVSQTPIPILEEPKAIRKFHFYYGLRSGIGQNSIEIRQSTSENHMQITNANSIQTYFMELSGGMRLQLNSWLHAFTGLQVGMINQNIRYATRSKSPEKFNMVAKDSLNFEMTPDWTEKLETRSQQSAYANLELGLKPLLSANRNSGPFASVILWTLISEKHNSNVPGSSPFIPVSGSFSLGYRLGYQHEIRKNILLEAFLSSVPSNIFFGTKGVTVSPRLLGIGGSYSF